MADFLERRRKIEEFKDRFTYEFLPELVGRQFHVPRGYGHAEYIIHGGHETWRLGRDRTKMLISISDGTLKPCNHGGPEVVVIVVERLGGYDGPCRLPTLQEILDEFEKEETE